MQAIVMNPEVIAIDQDPAGVAGDRLFNLTSGAQAWSKPLANGDKAVVLYNRAHHAAVPVSVTWAQLGWPADAAVAVRDLWFGAPQQHARPARVDLLSFSPFRGMKRARKDLGVFTHGYGAASVAPHDVQFLRLALQQQ